MLRLQPAAASYLNHLLASCIKLIANILSQIYDAIQLDVAWHLQKHNNIKLFKLNSTKYEVSNANFN